MLEVRRINVNLKLYNIDKWVFVIIYNSGKCMLFILLSVKCFKLLMKNGL